MLVRIASSTAIIVCASCWSTQIVTVHLYEPAPYFYRQPTYPDTSRAPNACRILTSIGQQPGALFIFPLRHEWHHQVQVFSIDWHILKPCIHGYGHPFISKWNRRSIENVFVKGSATSQSCWHCPRRSNSAEHFGRFIICVLLLRLSYLLDLPSNIAAFNLNFPREGF